jgi:hypothetical protein
VLQHDHLLPNLTVRETLTFAGRLRLPNTFTKQEKLQIVCDVATNTDTTHTHRERERASELEREIAQVLTIWLNTRSIGFYWNSDFANVAILVLEVMGLMVLRVVNDVESVSACNC